MFNKTTRIQLSKLALLILFSVMFSHVAAEDVFQEPKDFINESFSSEAPKSKVLWVTKSLKPEIYKIMGHDLNVLRIRYWREDKKTVWILNEIGKEHPITVGLVVKKNKLQRLKILIFRESRGGEVRHNFFTNQFKKIGITLENKLDTNIDGISGATLSVIALKKVTRLALYFHKIVVN